MTAVELFQALEQKFSVQVMYKVSFNTNLSADVLDVIKHLKVDPNPQDIAPNYPTMFSLLVKLPEGESKNFYQDSNTYLEAFDSNNFKEFLTKCLNHK